MNSITCRTLLGSFACFGFLSVATAAETPIPAEPAAAEAGYDRFTLRAGAFLLSNIKSTLRLDTAFGEEGDELDFEEDLGGEDSLTLFRADAEWRFAEKHRVGLTWFDINQDVRHQLTADIEWGDEVFPVDAVVDTHLGITVSKVNYGYAIFRKKDHEIFLLAGLHITRLETGISAPGLGRAESVSVTAPLPMFGLEWRARLSERFSSQVSYEYFGISVDDRYSGNLGDFQAFLDYRLTDHWSIGGGYNRYVLRAAAESENLKLTLKHSYNGLIGYLSARF